MPRVFNFILSLIILSQVASCAKTSDEEVASAISEAKFYLDSKKCSKAKSVLDDVGEEKSNADYVSIYASALACTASYEDFDMIDNLTDIDTAGANAIGFITSFAAFKTSNETDVDQITYTKVLEAIRYILEADGGTQPTTSARITKYGDKEGGDLSMQALMMTTVAIGKFFALYGDADSTGVKGAGGNNTCIYSYTMADAVGFIAAETPQSCVAATGTEGSAYLEAPVSATEIKSRLCEGIFLFNNFIDILGGISLSSNESLGNLSTVKTALDTAILFYEGIESATYNNVPGFQNSITEIKNIRSISTCEALDIEKIEKWYAILMESIF